MAAVALASSPALAQDYPTHPVRIVVPFAAGGSADVFGRYIAQKLQESMGQNFIVEDKPGAGSVIGTDSVAKSAPDGYTLLLMSNTHTVNESLIANKPFSLTHDFVPIGPISYSDLVLVARPGLPYSNLAELIAAAKAKPGMLTYASSGPGTPYHMAGELFKAMAGINLLHVPYKGSSAARADVMGGTVDLMFDAIATMGEQIKAGKVKALAVTGEARSPILPDVPTVAEAGVPGYEATIWLGLMAPKGTPAAIVTKLSTELAKITSSPETRKAWTVQGTTPMTMDSAAFGRYIDKDIVKWARIVKLSGARQSR
ncbi:MAG: tripartite tricarboxylate transporter substrate binding protein [Pseudomonadota bacterium]|nr:tripartite tricarboxylate transporter substrate binding protein [Pseudomonadota bacterium]